MPAEPIRKTLDIRRDIRQCTACRRRFSRDAVFCPYDGIKLEPATFNPLGDPLVGTTVDGRYEVQEVLGEGGMGRVYRVRHTTLERLFAMKVLRRDLARDEDLGERFLHEAKATASVKHPNVVQISDFGRLPDGIPYFVMELLVGTTLGEAIKAGGPIPAGRATRIITRVAGAIGAAHEAGVVHRDLKPDNVFLVGGSASDAEDESRARAMVGEGTDVRVVDFGAAKIIGSNRMTRTGIVFGTPHYMSPEQASGGTVDHRADIYALGIIMYEMFTGRVPFEADTYMGVLTQHMFVQPMRPSQVSEAAKELGALEDITLICLEKKPEDRFASMGDLAAAVQRVVRLRADGVAEVAEHFEPWPGRGPPQVRYRMADELEPPTMEEMRVAIQRSAWPRRTLLRVGVGAVGVTCLLAVVVGWGTSRAPPPAAAVVPQPRLPPAVSVEVLAAPAPPPPPSASEEVPPVASIPAASTVTATPPPPGRKPPAKRPPAPSAPAVDDIGDPFASKR
jgi:serine/threonine-protein kinase